MINFKILNPELLHFNVTVRLIRGKAKDIALTSDNTVNEIMPANLKTCAIQIVNADTVQVTLMSVAKCVIFDTNRNVGG